VCDDWSVRSAPPALAVPKTRDGRALFFSPWEGMTLCGTTDAPAPIAALPAPSATDVAFILEEANRYLNRKVRRRPPAAPALSPLLGAAELVLMRGSTMLPSLPHCR